MLGKLGQLQGGMPKGFDLKQLNENALRGAAGPGQAQQLDPRAQLQQMVQGPGEEPQSRDEAEP